MEKREVPNFLLSDIHTIDKTSLLNDLRLTVLWNFVNPNKPYDHQAAIMLQHRLHSQHEAKQKKHEQERIREREKAEKEALLLHRRIAELVFIPEVLGESDEVNSGEVGWNTPIRDKITRQTLGTPRSLFEDIGVDFRRRTDAREDLNAFLEEVKNDYDRWLYPFSFERRGMTSFELGKHPKYARFSIRLKWKSQPISARIRRKIEKLM